MEGNRDVPATIHVHVQVRVLYMGVQYMCIHVCMHVHGLCIYMYMYTCMSLLWMDGGMSVHLSVCLSVCHM